MDFDCSRLIEMAEELVFQISFVCYSGLRA